MNEFWHNLTNNIFQHIDYKLVIGSPWKLRFIIIKTCQRFVIMVLNLDEVNWIGCCWNTYIQYLFGFQKCPLRSYLSNCKSPCIVPWKLCIILYPWNAHWIFLNNKLKMDENIFFHNSFWQLTIETYQIRIKLLMIYLKAKTSY